jgi:DNA-binding NtrC family response regulator
VEEKRFTPLGSTTEKTGDVRIISASNHDLLHEVRIGRFREDLYYRLADLVITIPPIRINRDAIIPLTMKILEDTCGIMVREVPILDESAHSLLIDSPWPGNIRQLKSVIRRILIDAGDVITAQEISEAIQAGERRETSHTMTALQSKSSTPPPFPCSMDALEKWSLEQALQYCGGKRMKTASMLGMNYYTFKRRLKKQGIDAGVDDTDDR